MATSSPTTSNSGSPAPPPSLNAAAAAAAATANTSKSLRGLNKPKCIRCGNVARSRCPFQSCKSCCAKAQNPCHIHVLKNATFPEKTQSSGSNSFDQQSTEASPGASHRIASLRQLSNSFSQFNNLQSPLRSRRPLTRKEAAVINEWRFQKLKDYKEEIIETENEAFDRYMRNIGLLEEVLSVSPRPEAPTNHGTPTLGSERMSVENSNTSVLLRLKLKLRSKPVRIENSRKRVQEAVNQGLRKLGKIDSDHGETGSNQQNELTTKSGRVEFWSAERESSMSDLLDRLNKARNEEDLKSCLEIKSQLFGRHSGKSRKQIGGAEVSNSEIGDDDNSIGLKSDYTPPKWLSSGSVDQDDLDHVDSRFSLLEGIESL